MGTNNITSMSFSITDHVCCPKLGTDMLKNLRSQQRLSRQRSVSPAITHLATTAFLFRVKQGYRYTMLHNAPCVCVCVRVCVCSPAECVVGVHVWGRGGGGGKPLPLPSCKIYHAIFIPHFSFTNPPLSLFIHRPTDFSLALFSHTLQHLTISLPSTAPFSLLLYFPLRFHLSCIFTQHCPSCRATLPTIMLQTFMSSVIHNLSLISDKDKGISHGKLRYFSTWTIYSHISIGAR